MNMASKGFFNAFADVWMHEGVRTPMVDYCGALGHISPTDLGIKAAREALKRAGIAASEIGSVITGNMAPGDFDQFVLPRHIGLYAGVPQEVPAIMVQRICGTGFELFRQAGEQIEAGVCEAALVVGTESMTRNPIAAFDHRTGFKLGAPVGFKDFMWEALKDPAAGINMKEVGAMIFPTPAVRALSGLAADAPMSEVLASAPVLAKFQDIVNTLAQTATGSANRIARLCLLSEPPTIDKGEITDKGSINQRSVLAHRVDLVAALHAGGLPNIIQPQ
jgi:hypothetical protein